MKDRVRHGGLRKRCRCARRDWAKCLHPWHLNFHHAGVHHRVSLDAVAKARGERVPTTKAEAMDWRERIRLEIRRGEFVALGEVAPAAAPGPLTFGDIVDRYLERYVRVPTRRPRATKEFEYQLSMIRRTLVPAAQGTSVAFETKPVTDVTKADVEALRETRRRELAAAGPAAVEAADPAARRIRRPGSKAGEVGINRLLARLRHVFSWAIGEGYVQQTPFKRQGVTVIKLEHRAEVSRDRRLLPGEEARLLEHAGDRLRALIIAALNTGCRRGELLGLQWRHVRRDDQGTAIALALPASQTKTNQARVIPIGLKLRAVLELRPQNDPDGKPLGAEAHVFGNELGEPIDSIRIEWEAACEAAGIRDLHFHDLRREFACRLLESSADLHDVRDFLGHANISTTSTYLASTPVRLAKAIERLDGAAPTSAPDKDLHADCTNGSDQDGQTVTH